MKSSHRNRIFGDLRALLQRPGAVDADRLCVLLDDANQDPPFVEEQCLPYVNANAPRRAQCTNLERLEAWCERLWTDHPLWELDLEGRIHDGDDFDRLFALPCLGRVVSLNLRRSASVEAARVFLEPRLAQLTSLRLGYTLGYADELLDALEERGPEFAPAFATTLRLLDLSTFEFDDEHEWDGLFGRLTSLTTLDLNAIEAPSPLEVTLAHALSPLPQLRHLSLRGLEWDLSLEQCITLVNALPTLEHLEFTPWSCKTQVVAELLRGELVRPGVRIGRVVSGADPAEALAWYEDHIKTYSENEHRATNGYMAGLIAPDDLKPAPPLVQPLQTYAWTSSRDGREITLGNEHLDAWVEALDHDAPCLTTVEHIEFKQGYGAQPLSGFSTILRRTLEQCPKLQSLSLVYHGLSVEDAVDLAACEELGRIQRLEVDNWSSEPWLETLLTSPHMRNLRDLDMRSTPIKLVELLTWADCEGVRNLHRLCVDWHWDDVASGPVTLPHLEWLDLRIYDALDYYLDDNSKRRTFRLEDVLDTPNLTHLSIQDYGNTLWFEQNTHDEVLIDPGGLPRLRYLNHSGCRVGAAQLALWNDEDAFPELETLLLANCMLSDECARTLTRLPFVGRLHTLGVGSNHTLTDDGLRHILHAPELSRLDTLCASIDDAHFSYDFDSVLAHAPLWKSLRRLYNTEEVDRFDWMPGVSDDLVYGGYESVPIYDATDLGGPDVPVCVLGTTRPWLMY